MFDLELLLGTAPWGSGLEWVLRVPWSVVEGEWMGRSFGWGRRDRGPVSRWMWRDGGPSLLGGLGAGFGPRF
jgi:hypothetical protein